jgi:hypothetical protein
LAGPDQEIAALRQASTDPREALRCLSIHAERLEDEVVWSRTCALLRRVQRCGGRATLFVHPWAAIERGIDLGPRLRELSEQGHEIAQHTHFYGPVASSGRKPAAIFTAENVRRCLDRDFAYLTAAGTTPKGFVAGQWAIIPEAARWLQEHSFEYDSSVRTFDLKYENPQAASGDSWDAPSCVGGVILLPTTHTLRDAVLGPSSPLVRSPIPYTLGYLHDYDLVRQSHVLASRVVVMRWKRGPWTTASGLASRVGELLDD